jgi:hypothetical protein
MAKFSRRRVLMASALLVAPAATACSRSPQEEAAPTLHRMARLLYPHRAVADTAYAQAADGVLADAVAAPAQRDLLLTGVRALNAGAPGGWLRLPEEDQIAALRRIESGAFFEAVRAGVRDRLYALPAVWTAIGYPGSSLEFGGYRTRGFDDIDWLPEVR